MLILEADASKIYPQTYKVSTVKFQKLMFSHRIAESVY